MTGSPRPFIVRLAVVAARQPVACSFWVELTVETRPLLKTCGLLTPAETSASGDQSANGFLVGFALFSDRSISCRAYSRAGPALQIPAQIGAGCWGLGTGLAAKLLLIPARFPD